MVEVTRGKADRRGLIDTSVLSSRCLFFREIIRGYRHVSPLLIGMLVHAAHVPTKDHQWLWGQDDQRFAAIATQLQAIVENTALRYDQLDAQYMAGRQEAARGIRLGLAGGFDLTAR